MIKICGNCKWWKRVHLYRGMCIWPTPKLPRIAELVRNVAWENGKDCSVWKKL